MRRGTQSGVTLLELLVGLAIGLMTIAVALGALLISRGVSGTVSDASQLQQQAAFALRVAGRQLRQAGGIRLNTAFGAAAGATDDPAQPVAFENTFDRRARTLQNDATYALRVGYQNYTETVSGNATPQSLLSDCLGRGSTTAAVVQSDFRLDRASGAATGNLLCRGTDGSEEMLIGNVADFQVRYLVQTLPAGGVGAGTMRRVAPAAMAAADWASVVAVDICLELAGDENIDTAGATYRNCAQSEVAHGNRMHLVLRNTFQLRSQGTAR